MAQRRMFHTDVVESDRFLDLSPGAQLLYFHLGMQADDDGFVNGPKQICRKLQCRLRDLNSLVKAGFLINFDGIMVLKHFRVANSLKNDRRKPLAYPELAKKLAVEQNRCYTTDFPVGTKTLYDLRTSKVESGLEKSGIHLPPEENRTEENRTEENRTEENQTEENLTQWSRSEGPEERPDQLRFMGGTLGKGVLLLSNDQIEYLLDYLGLDAFNYYTDKLSTLLQEKKIKSRSHYDTIMQWYREDKEVRK